MGSRAAVTTPSTASHAAQDRSRTIASRAGAPAVRATTLRLGVEAVADARLRHDQRGAYRVALELPPEAGDVHPQVLLRVAVLPRPHPGEELLVCHGPPGVGGEHAEELPLDGRHVDRGALAGHDPAREVDDHVPSPDARVTGGAGF